MKKKGYFLVGLNQSSIESQIVRQVFRAQGRLSLLFSSMINGDNLKRILNGIIQSSPPKQWAPSDYCPIYFYAKWSSQAILGYFEEESLFSAPSDFYLSLIESENNSVVKLVYSYIISTDSFFSDPESLLVIENLKLFRQRLPGLYKALQPKMNAVLSRVSPKILFQQLGIDVLLFKFNISVSEIQQFQISNLKGNNLKLLLNHLMFLEDDKVPNSLQMVLDLVDQYPSNSSLFNQDSLFNLMNSSCSKKKHYIDMSLFFIKRLLISGDQKLGLSLLSHLPGFLPYITVCIISNFGNKSKSYDFIIQEAIQYSDPSFVKEYLLRLSNDKILINRIFKIVGEFLSVYDFTNKSIPMNILPAINSVNIEDVRFMEDPLTLVSDKNRKIDYEFLLYYFSLYHMLKQSSNFIEIIASSLSMMSSNHLRSSLTVDLFSIFFLSNLDYDIVIAIGVLLIIKPFFPNLLIWELTFYWLSYLNSIGIKGLSRCMIPKYTIPFMILTNTTSNEQEGYIYKAIQNDTSLKTKVDIVLSMKRYITNRSISQDIKSSNLFAEIYFSYNTSIQQNVFENPIINSLIAKRKSKSHPMSVVGSTTLQNALIMVSNNGYECLGNQFNRFRLFNSFSHYLKLLKTIFPSAAYDNLPLLTIISLVDHIKKITDGMNWDRIVTIVGPGTLDLMFNYSLSIENSKELLELLDLLPKVLSFSIISENVYSKQIDKSCLLNIIENKCDNKCLPILKYYRKICQTEKPKGKLSITEYEKSLIEPPNEANFDMFFGEIDGKYNVDEMNAVFWMDPEQFYLIPKSKLLLSDMAELDGFAEFKSVYKIRNLYDGFFDEWVIIERLYDQKDWGMIYFFLNDFVINYELIGQLSLKIVKSPEHFGDLIETNPLLSNYLHIRKNIIIKKDTSIDFQIVTKAQIIDTLNLCMSSIEKLEAINVKLNEIIENQINEVCLSKNVLSCIIEETTNAISELFIDSILGELYISQLLSQISESFQIIRNHVCFSKHVQLHHSQIDRISLISSFTNCMLYSHFYQKIDHSVLNQPNPWEYYINICYIYDFWDMLLTFCQFWGVDSSIYILKRSHLCFSIGLLSDGLTCLGNLMNTMKSNKSKITTVFPPTRLYVESIIDVLSHSLLLDLDTLIGNESVSSQRISHNLIDNKDDVAFVHLRWRTILSNRIQVVFESEQMNVLRQILVSFNETRKLIVFLISSGNIENAFNVWNMVDSERKKADFFRNALVFPSLAFENWNSFWRKFIKDPKLSVEMQAYVEDLIDYLTRLHMGRTAYDIQTRLFMYDDAIISAVYSFVYVKSWKKRLKLSQIIKDTISYRHRYTNNPIYPQKNNMNESMLYSLYHRARLQIYLINYCNQNNIGFNPDLEIIFSKKNTLFVSKWMVHRYNISFVLDLAQYSEFSLKEIISESIDELKTNHNTTLPTFIQSISLDNIGDYIVIMTIIFDVLSERVADKQLLKQLISSFVKVDKCKAQLYINHGHIREAFDFCKKKKLFEYMKIISDISLQNNDNDTAKAAQKLVPK